MSRKNCSRAMSALTGVSWMRSCGRNLHGRGGWWTPNTGRRRGALILVGLLLSLSILLLPGATVGQVAFLPARTI